MFEKEITYYWHVLNNNMKPDYGEEPAWTVGETRKLSRRPRIFGGKKIEICDFGYHACPEPHNIFEVVDVESTDYLCKVELFSIKGRHSNKVVARGRRLVAAIPMLELLTKARIPVTTYGNVIYLGLNTGYATRFDNVVSEAFKDDK